VQNPCSTARLDRGDSGYDSTTGPKERSTLEEDAAGRIDMHSVQEPPLRTAAVNSVRPDTLLTEVLCVSESVPKVAMPGHHKLQRTTPPKHGLRGVVLGSGLHL
jgi:hypothetical protein